MDNSRQATLVLGGTGRTGSLVASKLAERGLSTRTASRHGADVPFDWTTRQRTAPPSRVPTASTSSHPSCGSGTPGWCPTSWISPKLRGTPRHLPQRLRERPGPAGGRHQGRRTRPHKPAHLHVLGPPPRVGHAELHRRTPARRPGHDHGAHRKRRGGVRRRRRHRRGRRRDAGRPRRPRRRGVLAHRSRSAHGGRGRRHHRRHRRPARQPQRHRAQRLDRWRHRGRGRARRLRRHAQLADGTIASGHGSRPNDDVRRVTGSPPASFADFAHRNARAWAVPAAHP